VLAHIIFLYQEPNPFLQSTDPRPGSQSGLPSAISWKPNFEFLGPFNQCIGDRALAILNLALATDSRSGRVCSTGPTWRPSNKKAPEGIHADEKGFRPL
jgi:hypothetical protein